MFGKILSYPRGVLLIFWLVVHTLLCSITMVLASYITSRRSYFDFHARALWARPVLWLSNLKVEVRGHENLRQNRGGIMVFNHTSWLDILILMGTLPVTPRFGAKAELFRLPFFGRAMRAMGVLQIDRSNRSKVLEVYKQAEVRAKNGECFALAPEGTRQIGYELGKFKQGPFLFALGASSPLIPIVIAGAQEAMPKTSWLINVGQWQRRVLVAILPEIETRGLSESDLSALQEGTRAMMAKSYRELNSELGVLPP